MKILSCSVSNFASYKSLEFQFDGQGLTLISGPTGSGKSTLCDIVPWILFGKTAKGGTVDEIRSWNSDEPTTGNVYLGRYLHVFRKRGATAKDNDLYYKQYGGYEFSNNLVEHRGKDIQDTQKMINNLLGFDYELYMSAAYFHEFSHTAQFFTTNAKVRRQITEQMVDLTLAKKLAEKLSSYNKDLKDEQKQLTQQLLIKKGWLQTLNIQVTTIKQKYYNWNVTNTARLVKLEEEYELFDKVKDNTLKKLEERRIRYDSESQRDTKILTEELIALQSRLPKAFYSTSKRKELEDAIKACDKDLCEHCGAPKKNTQKMVLIDQLHEYKMEEQRITNTQAEIVNIRNSLERNQKLVNPYPEQIKQEKARENTYMMQLDLARLEVNPYEDQVLTLNNDKNSLQKDVDMLQADTGVLQTEFSDVELLSQVTDDFRSLLVKNIIRELETSVNKLLTDHFDAEIKVAFETAENDKLDVTIAVNGNLCSFSQLSKGQRQLLKLTFGISVMTCIQNHHGISFNCLWLDEAFEGLSEQLKVQSYGLLQKLAVNYESVFVVEHSQELKAMFENKIEVELVNGESQLA